MPGTLSLATANLPHSPTMIIETPNMELSEAQAAAMINGESLLRTGWLYKRGGRAKAWKRRWFVLRKDRFAYYKDQNEVETRQVVPMDDLSGVACKPAGRRCEVSFYVADKQVHLQAETMEDAEAWVRALKMAIKLEPKQSATTSPIKIARTPGTTGQNRLSRSVATASGSPPNMQRSSMSRSVLFSDDEHTGLSDEDFTSPLSEATTPEAPTGDYIPTRSVNDRADHDKVITQGYVRRHFNSRRRSSTHLWAVLRPYGLYLYPDHKEYRPSKIVPIAEIVDAHDLAQSKNHGKKTVQRYRFQVITRDKAMRFSVDQEEQLDTWVGALKSRLEMQERASFNS